MPSYLRRRGCTWFFRWKWPRRLAGGGGSGELIRSLKTADYRTARRRALMLALKIPLAGLIYIVWWAIKQEPEEETQSNGVRKVSAKHGRHNGE